LIVNKLLSPLLCTDKPFFNNDERDDVPFATPFEISRLGNRRTGRERERDGEREREREGERERERSFIDNQEVTEGRQVLRLVG
jgi:hypothetical protein